MTQRAVWSDRVVVDAPLFDKYLCFSERVEDLSVEQFGSKVTGRQTIPGA
jgi:hypothetical protein